MEQEALKEKEELELSQMSLDLSSESDGADNENPDDNKIDKAFKKLQKKKDNFIRFSKKVKDRRAEKEAESKGENP